MLSLFFFFFFLYCGPAVLLGMRSFPVVFHGFCRCLQKIALLTFGDIGAAAFSGNTFEWLPPSLVFIHLYLIGKVFLTGLNSP